jgi:AcrR family transcriptional regulator
MPYQPPFPTRHELLTLAMLELARERGVHDMSIRGLASAVRAAPGSLTYHYRDKDALLSTCARLLGAWLAHDMVSRLATRGVAALLPDPDATDQMEEREYALRLRVWLQMSAYGLTSPAVAVAVRRGDARIGEGVAREIGEQATGQVPRGIPAVIKGLAMALLQPETEMSAPVAANILDRVLLGRPTNNGGATDPEDRPD